jgi:uridine kinase
MIREPITIEVRVGDEGYRVAPGTRIADFFGVEAIRRDEIVAAVLDNHLVDLRAEIASDARIRPISRTHPDGRGVVRRAVKMMLHAALRERYPDVRACVGQSLLGGYFYEVNGDGPALDLEQMAVTLSEALAELAEVDEPFVHRTVPIEAALRELDDPSGAKARLLEAWSAPQVPIVGLRAFRDIQHGPYPPSTRAGRGARVVPYPPGLVLQFPGEAAPGPRDGRRLWETYRESRDHHRRLGVYTVGDLNRAVLDGRIDEVIRVSEALQEKRIAAIADEIAARRGRVRVVCVAGPSSSGKTTFVERLRVQLRVNGVEPHTLNLDNYYRPREDCPRDENGAFDFEVLEALNVSLLQEHVARLLAGSEVRVPRFDFTTQRPRPEAEWRSLRLEPEALLVLEGIHGLNPALLGAVDHGVAYRVFVSALTQLVIDEHNRIFTSEQRLLRRIVRDRRFRGTRAADTIERWPSVRRGEDRHIFPFQERCDVMFDSSLTYETAVLKSFAVRYLLEVPRQHPSRLEAWRLMKFLELFIPVFPDDVPATSVLREFMGGSAFHY